MRDEDPSYDLHTIPSDMLMYESMLHKACYYGYAYTVKTLLSIGRIKIDAQCSHGLTSLHYACAASKVDVVKVLLSRNADPNIVSERGVAPIHVSSRRGDTYIVQLLLDHGANPMLLGPEGNTALHYASLGSHVGVIELFMSTPYIKRIKVNVRNKKKHTALFYLEDPPFRAETKPKKNLIAFLKSHNAR
jgi:ankyrin repeat protein